MFIYHYHAVKQLGVGTEIHVDGISILDRPVVTMDDYDRLKGLIANIPGGKDIGGPGGLAVRSLTLLHETPNVKVSGLPQPDGD